MLIYITANAQFGYDWRIINHGKMEFIFDGIINIRMNFDKFLYGGNMEYLSIIFLILFIIYLIKNNNKIDNEKNEKYY